MKNTKLKSGIIQYNSTKSSDLDQSKLLIRPDDAEIGGQLLRGARFRLAVSKSETGKICYHSEPERRTRWFNKILSEGKEATH